MSDLAERIARREHDGTDEVPSEDVTAVSLDLRHCHVPMLVEADLVSRVGDRTVAPADREINVEAGLEALVD